MDNEQELAEITVDATEAYYLKCRYAQVEPIPVASEFIGFENIYLYDAGGRQIAMYNWRICELIDWIV